jgi:hypothetical protein
MIFVTAEEKQDWWVRNHGAFQPRVELLEEMHIASVLSLKKSGVRFSYLP